MRSIGFWGLALSTGACGSRSGRPGVVSISLRDIEHDAIHRAMNLVEERPIPLANNRKHPPQLACCLKRPLLNDESHE
jgi:hypothetical protein